MIYKIKVIKDTFLHKKDTGYKYTASLNNFSLDVLKAAIYSYFLDMTEFKEYYHDIWGNNRNYANERVIACLKMNVLDPDTQYKKSFFEVININDFKVGDWVWHERDEKAYYVVEYNLNIFPNNCTINAANTYLNFYKRLATENEIMQSTLKSFCDGKILIGRNNCYYFDIVWKEIYGVQSTIKEFMKKEYQSTPITFSSKLYNCRYLGLKIGCTEVRYEEIQEIAKFLGI